MRDYLQALELDAVFRTHDHGVYRTKCGTLYSWRV